MSKAIASLTSLLINFLFWSAMTLIVWLFLQIVVFTSFKVPTDSMEPSIESGDYVLVFKPIIGARVFNLFASLRGEEVEIYRLPGWRKVKRGDVLAFHRPYPKNRDKIEMNLMQYYMKRCIGLPGDTLEIRDSYYKIWGVNEELGYLPGQKQVSLQKQSAMEKSGTFHAFPFDSVAGWNIQQFGPLYIPAKGDSIAMNRRHYLLYRRMIEWEQQTILRYHEEEVWLNDQLLEGYRFRNNYYFMGGDKSQNSQDSRYWGLLPETFIVGKACFVWKSIDPYSGQFRWDRFFKQIQ